MGVRFFAALVVDGALAGALYALVALSFVVVYRASRMMNFAVGEWVMLASRCVTFALHGLGLGLPGALAVGCAGMAGFGVAFNRVVLRRLVGQPVVSVIMVTIGLGALVRGAAALWTLGAGGGRGMVLVGLKVFPIVIIGGLDSIAGTIVGALAVGMLESLAAGYLDPPLGGGFSNIASYLVLLAALFVRPYGLFGRPDVRRV